MARGGRVLTNATAALNRAMLSTGTLDPPVVYTMHIPLGPWPVGANEGETRWIRRLGEMMRQNALEFVHTLRPMLKTQGFEDGVIDKLMAGANAGTSRYSLVHHRPAPSFLTTGSLNPIFGSSFRIDGAVGSHVHPMGVRVRYQTPQPRGTSIYTSTWTIDFNAIHRLKRKIHTHHVDFIDTTSILIAPRHCCILIPTVEPFNWLFVVHLVPPLSLFCCLLSCFLGIVVLIASIVIIR